MKTKFLLGALALTMSTAVFAADPVPAPKKECCCCEKDEHGKMACCKDSAEKPSDDHAGNDMNGMEHK